MGVNHIVVLMFLACCFLSQASARIIDDIDDEICEWGQSYPHANDCHQFYKCTFEADTFKTIVSSCPQGSFFHPVLRLCYLESSETQCQSNNVGFKDDTCDADKDKPKCVDCSTFAYCNSFTSTWTYGKCPKGFCDPVKVKCLEDVPACIPFQCGDDDGTFPDSSNCTKYHMCKGGKETPGVCDNGKAFNPVSLICDKAIDDATCNKTIVNCDMPQPSAIKKLPVTSNCLQYHKCDVSKEYKDALVAIYYNCPKGQFFAYNSTYETDPKGGQCLNVSAANVPSDEACKEALSESGVHCLAGGFNPIEPCPTMAYYCSPDTLKELGKITCPDGQAFDKDNCKDFADVTSCKDLCKEDTLKKKNPSDCTTYFECDKVGGTPKVKKCPDGQAFNGAKGDCDDKANVPLCQT